MTQSELKKELAYVLKQKELVRSLNVHFKGYKEYFSKKSPYILSDKEFFKLKGHISELAGYGVMDSRYVGTLVERWISNAPINKDNDKTYIVTDSSFMSSLAQETKELYESFDNTITDINEEIKNIDIFNKAEKDKIIADKNAELLKRSIQAERKNDILSFAKSIFSNKKYNYIMVGILAIYILKSK